MAGPLPVQPGYGYQAQDYPRLVRTADLTEDIRNYLRETQHLRGESGELPEEVAIYEGAIRGDMIKWKNTKALTEKIQKTGINQQEAKYDCFTTNWTDEVVAGIGYAKIENVRVLPSAGPPLYEGVSIRSLFSWRGFCSGQVELALTDLEIRFILTPALEAIKRGDTNAWLELTHSSEEENGRGQVTIVFSGGTFSVKYAEAGEDEFSGSGAQAVFGWLQHFVQYFQEKERAF